MKTVGFVMSHKENENRRVVMPEDIGLFSYPDMLYFESGYWKVLGVEDCELKDTGIHIVSREQALRQDIICDPKVGDADYLSLLCKQTVFGWIHAVQNRDITDKLINGKLTCYAWEDMFDCGRHIFWRNNEIAGEAAIMHAFRCYGDMPYNAKVALVGMGNVAQGALKILTLLGAEVTVYNRKTESLLRRELPCYDAVVNAVLWDVNRSDHLISREDLGRMKKNSLIIDISCDRGGGIETSIPTEIENPTYMVDGIMHYVVDHTPSLYYRTVSKELSKIVPEYINMLITGQPDSVLANAEIITSGVVKDERINRYQHR